MRCCMVSGFAGLVGGPTPLAAGGGATGKAVIGDW